MNDRTIHYLKRGLWTDECIGYLSSSAAERWGDKDFLRLEDERFSFAALHRWVVVVSHFLVANNVSAGDRVLIQSGNCIELLVLHLATWRVGAVSVPVVPIYRAREMGAVLDATRPVVVAAARVFGSRMPCAELDELLISSGYAPTLKLMFGGGELLQGWATIPRAPSCDDALTEDGLPPPAAADDCCMILFTSGTTAAPKGAMINSHALISGTQNWRLNLGLTSRDVFFTGAPITHIGALFSAFLVPISLGARTIIISHWNPDRAVFLINEERADVMAGATVFLQDLVERYEQDKSFDHRLKIYISGGAATSPSLIERAERVGIKAGRVYGMTETCGTLAQTPIHAGLEIRANTDGRVSYGTEIEIVDENREVLPPGEIGEIRFRSPQLMIGYLDREITATQMTTDGWFYPGDLATMTPDGWLHMVGRTKDIINRGGEKFSSQDIEAALASYRPILDVAVIALPDPRMGEKVCACIILRGGEVWDGPEKVFQHLNTINLARPKFPVEWAVLTEFPRTASGKVQKHILYKIVMEQISNPQ